MLNRNFFKQNKLYTVSCATSLSALNTPHPYWADSTHYGVDYYGKYDVAIGDREPGINFLASNYINPITGNLPSPIGYGMRGYWWARISTGYYGIRSLNHDTSVIGSITWDNHYGCAIRGCRNTWDEENALNDGTKLIGNYTDGSGNVYDGIKIGKRIWMTENLKTSKLQDGTDIELANNSTDWLYYADEFIKEPAMMTENWPLIYGHLYNHWCPTNDIISGGTWRVSTVNDWVDLHDFIDYTHGPDWEAYFLKSCRQINHPLG